VEEPPSPLLSSWLFVAARMVIIRIKISVVIAMISQCHIFLNLEVKESDKDNLLEVDAALSRV
jgi:hypothetical protein